ncbi:suppressor of fused domain protein [Acinetobacter pittii]|uniref:suppressor of fused domain protein n=1 Tax=Acinetobacter pittii TaxID=48296 RepID=UPI00197E502D|nr:suppressor of fused domain protein [Acinetobacter pittii]MBN6528058.1 suppressor of fused domain protein [Acinetobacter pittii]
MLNKLKKLIGLVGLTSLSTVSCAQQDQEAVWQNVYNTRTQYYEENLGKLPDDILKIVHMAGVWPGGGLYVIPADKIGKDITVYSTFGLTNSDMPAQATVSDVKVEKDNLGRVVSSSANVKSKTQTAALSGAAGYGYELILMTKDKNAEWPLWFLQWAVQAELLNDAGFLKRVEKYNGLTVEAISVGENENDKINVLITKAQKPLPLGTQLPNGKMEFLVAIVITDEEMKWSMKNGRNELASKLMEAGVGQLSDRNRPSVIGR